MAFGFCIGVLATVAVAGLYTFFQGIEEDGKGREQQDS